VPGASAARQAVVQKPRQRSNPAGGRQAVSSRNGNGNGGRYGGRQAATPGTARVAAVVKHMYIVRQQAGEAGRGINAAGVSVPGSAGGGSSERTPGGKPAER